MVITFCLVLAWGIQTLINRRALKQPPKSLTPEELRRHKRNRIFVAPGLTTMVAIAVLSVVREG